MKKNSSKKMIVDPMGQWKHPGENTRIPGSNITMKGVNYPVLGVPNNGHEKMMYPGEEYTFPEAKYVDEFPQLRKGGRTRGLIPMPKPSKKGLASKKYSRSLEATNRLFTENKLFKKPKSRKNKVFDPRAKYYQDGGQQDAMNAMMKARLAYANEFGNPAAQRMINIPDNPYEFENGDTGTHYMSSMDNYAVPQIQDENGQLMLGDYGPDSREAMRFESDDDADYFAEHYKDIAPGFVDMELDDNEIQQYVKGGYVVEEVNDPSIPKLGKFGDGGSPKSKWIAPAERYSGRSNVDPRTGLIYKDFGDVDVKAGKKGFKKKVKSFFQKDLGKLTKEAEELGKGVGYIAGVQGDIEPAVYNREGLNKFKSEVKRLKGDFNKELKTAEKNRKQEAADREDYEQARKKAQSSKDPNAGSNFARKYEEKNWSRFDPAVMKEGYKGQFQDAVDEANIRKEANMGVTMAALDALGGGAYNIIKDPMGTLTGVANTALEAVTYPFDSDNKNVFGEKYGQDIDDVMNVLGVLPVIGALKGIRPLLKSKTGVTFGKALRPVKKGYKKMMRKYDKFADPILNTNLAKTGAAGLDVILNTPGTAQNLISKVPSNIADLGTVKNAIKSVSLAKGTGSLVEGVSGLQGAAESGNRADFDKAISNLTNAGLTATMLHPKTEWIWNASTFPAIQDNISDLSESGIDRGLNLETVGNTALDAGRLINNIKALPRGRFNWLPKTKMLKYIKSKHIRPNLKEGGVVTSLSKKEIDDLIAQGYIIEELD